MELAPVLSVPSIYNDNWTYSVLPLCSFVPSGSGNVEPTKAFSVTLPNTTRRWLPASESHAKSTQGGVSKRAQHWICCTWGKAGCRSPALGQRGPETFTPSVNSTGQSTLHSRCMASSLLLEPSSSGIPRGLEAQRGDSDMLETEENT